MVVVPISPVPPIAIFKLGLVHGELLVDGHEHYVKQTIRNRYHILTANGVLALTINVKSQGGERLSTGNIGIDYDKPWVRTHLRAIEAAYRSSPYFEHYFQEVCDILETPHSTLQDFFEASFPKWQKLLKASFDWKMSDKYVENGFSADFRIRAKSPLDFPQSLHSKPYIQVFSDRYPYQPNLSIIDLLFNLGPEAISHLKA